MDQNYKNVYGTWLVSTEGDVEGRTTKVLGCFTGYVDEIALHLADKCYYTLEFKIQGNPVKYIPKRQSVNVRFDVYSNTWDMDEENRLNEMRKIFGNRPIKIENANVYASFKIVSSSEKEKILNKLTKEEKEILGL